MNMSQNETLEQLKQQIAALQQENAKLKRKTKYGLVWEDKPEDLDDKNVIPLFSKNEELSLPHVDNQPENYLIEGDNYHSLKVLQHTHKGKIDVIYIDPPYNTGNTDFVYNDKYVDADDGFRHSKWLSFMDKRLRLAHSLLSDKGTIFVSIGDDEVAQLKLLLDKIFNESNYISMISRVTKHGGSKGININPNNDYVLIYAKNKTRMPNFNKLTNPEYLERYKHSDSEGRYLLDGFFRPSMQLRPNQRYYMECPDGSFIIPAGKTYPSIIADGSHITPITGDKVWRWSYERYLNSKNHVVFKKTSKPNKNFVDENGKHPNWNVYKKVYLDDESSGVLQSQNQTGFPNTAGTEILKDMQIDFDFSKPIGLIKWCLKLHPNKSATVLDFFAGSGTTGHAVMELNAEDGGKRSFILCTNNEVSPEQERNYLANNTDF